MDDRRLNDWLEHASVMPENGLIGVFNAWPGLDLPGIDRDRVRAVQPFQPDNATLASAGYKTARIVNYRYRAVVLRVPREKDLARSYLKDAIRRTIVGDPIIIDGQKTDGVESLLKYCRKHFAVQEVISKAHGKLFWFSSPSEDGMLEAARDLPEPTPTETDLGLYTAPGVFSADGPDKASVFLADNLPPLSGEIADLGAGWGYLSKRLLETSKPDALHLVEADWLALNCAQKNVAHDKASFHWADALTWRPDTPVDHVVTNPPFHVGRAADPSLGQAFIRAAAAMLKPKGQLWLVANRRLPYEGTLKDAFRTVELHAETPSFKVFHATSPTRLKGK